jgi:hypothetical protein
MQHHCNTVVSATLTHITQTSLLLCEIDLLIQDHAITLHNQPCKEFIYPHAIGSTLLLGTNKWYPHHCTKLIHAQKDIDDIQTFESQKNEIFLHLIFMILTGVATMMLMLTLKSKNSF